MSYMKDAYLQVLEAIPADLHGYRQFVCWRRGPTRPNGKFAKIPVNPHTGKAASVVDPATWGTLEDAADGFLQYHADGLGFVLTDDDPFVVFDIDDLYSYELPTFGMVFRSVSGNGWHFWVRGEWPESRGCRWLDNEVYARRRFIALGTPETTLDAIPEYDLSKLEG